MVIDDLFTQALGLSSPWKVVSTEFDPAAKSLQLVIDFERGARFPDPESGELCSVHDTVQRTWEHLRFFEHKTTLRARVPRIKTPSGAVKTVEVPWAKPHGGFTLLMEAYLLSLARVLPVAEVSRQTGVSEDRIWHLVRTRVKEAWEKEGSKAARLLFFTFGKDAGTVQEFAAELERRGVAASQVNEIAMDMSKAFIAGARDNFPDAQICFDRFHVMKLCGEAIDSVRKDIARSAGGLPRGALWALRGNVDRLSEQQRELREQICKQHQHIARALSIREFLADTWNYVTREDAAEHLKSVLSWCSRSRLKPFVKLGRTLRRHLDGILGYYKNYTTSAAIEAVNGLLQLARRRARGYRRFHNFRAIAYWIAGGLTLETEGQPTH